MFLTLYFKMHDLQTPYFKLTDKYENILLIA